MEKKKWCFASRIPVTENYVRIIYDNGFDFPRRVLVDRRQGRKRGHATTRERRLRAAGRRNGSPQVGP
jgi:hypothetical protein